MARAHSHAVSAAGSHNLPHLRSLPASVKVETRQLHWLDGVCSASRSFTRLSVLPPLPDCCTTTMKNHRALHDAPADRSFQPSMHLRSLSLDIRVPGAYGKPRRVFRPPLMFAAPHAPRSYGAMHDPGHCEPNMRDVCCGNSDSYGAQQPAVDPELPDADRLKRPRDAVQGRGSACRAPAHPEYVNNGDRDHLLRVVRCIHCAAAVRVCWTLCTARATTAVG
jgi:hypothetical protein